MSKSPTSSHPAPGRILVIRTDRLGDVVLSTPVLTTLREQYPESYIALMVAPFTRELVENHPALNHLMIDDTKGSHKGIFGFFRLVNEIHRHHFDTVMLLHPTLRLAMACRLAGVPHRLGTGYRGYSLLFNHRVFEHRKNAQRHEVDYNLSLVQALTGEQVSGSPNIRATDEARQSIKKRLRQWGLEPGHFAVLHPGSSGSARDWPADSFTALGTKLIQSGIQVIITGGKQESHLIQHMVDRMPVPPITAVGDLSIKELTALLEMAAICITNSTGPLHIAAAVDTSTVALFCPITPCSPIRWGPYGGNHKVLTPEVPSCPRCIEEACPYFDCMIRISVDSVFEAVQDVLGTSNHCR